MLADSPERPAQSIEPPVGDRPVGRRASRANTIARLLSFTLACGLVLVYALRGGGSYDSVVFEEHGLVIWVLLGVGYASGLLPRARPSRWQLALLSMLALYTGWTALSLTWTSSSELTFEEVCRCLDYLGLIALVGAALDRESWRAAGAGLGFGAMLVCLVAVGSRLAPGIFGVDRVDHVLHLDRLSVPFGYWNAVAAWGAICTVVGLAWSVQDTVRWRRSVALALVPAAALTTYLTYSRAGVAGIALALVLAVGLSRSRVTALLHAVAAVAGSAIVIVAVRGAPEIAHSTGTGGWATVLGALLVAAVIGAATAFSTSAAGVDNWRLPRRMVRAAIAVAALAILVSAFVFGPHLANRAWHSFTRIPTTVSSESTTGRLTSLSGTRYPVWKTAIKAFEAHPVGGLGAGTFSFYWNEYGTDDEHLLDVHNIWLQNLAELGVPGLLLILAVAGSAVGLCVAVRRRARRATSAGVATAFTAALAVYLLHASVDWMWESTAVTVLALAGVAVLGARLSGERRPLPMPLRGMAATIASLAAIAQLPGVVSTTDIRHSQSAARAGNGARALVWAQEAVSAEPWSASAHEQLGLVYEAEGRLSAAAAELRDAVSNEPLNYEHWLVLSRIETESDHLGSAQRDYKRARQLAPRAVVFALARYFRGAPTRSP